MNKTYSRSKRKNVLLAGVLLMAITLVTAGCDDDFLTTVPQDEISSAIFWSDERDFNVALNGVYNRMMGVNHDPMYFDGATDNGYSHADWMRQHGTVMGRADALSGWSGGMWGRLFEGISRANEVLYQLDEAEDGILSPDAAAHMRGQVLFLRGYFYHQLLWMFGEVPIFTSVPTVEEAREISRSSREEVYNRVISDLTEAAGLLPNSWPGNQWGRATRGAALGYHARTAFYEAGWQQNHEQNQARANELYRVAAEKAQEVINLNEYSLHPNFRDLFTYAGEQSNEVILDYQRVSGQNGWSAWTWFAPSAMGGFVEVAPTRQLVDRFPMADGLPINESPLYNPEPPRITYDGAGNSNVETIGKYADRDPRFYGTILYPGAEFNGVVYNSYPPCGSGAPEGYCSPTSDAIVVTNFNNTYSGYTAMKYVDPADQSSPTNSGLNFIKMRYADILLMYAEAKAELGELDDSVQDAIQQIRDRAGVPLPVDLTSMSQADAINFIRDERVIELAWEGLYLPDIRRWATAEEVLNGITHGIDVARGDGSFSPLNGIHARSFAAPRDYLWPIPASERDLNPNLGQNPGY